MAVTPIPEEDLGRGVDQFHPEHRIPPGFIENARDFDPTPWGTLRKRVGYQLFAGFVPLRVSDVSRNGSNQLLITLDASSSVVANLRSSPIVVAGRASAAGGGFNQTTIAARRFSGFSVSGNSLVVSDAGAAFGPFTFEGAVWGIDPSTLDFSEADNPASGIEVDHLDYFKNSSVQHPVCAMRGAFFAARDTPDAGVFPSSTPSVSLNPARNIPFAFAVADVSVGADTITITPSESFVGVSDFPTGALITFSGTTLPTVSGGVSIGAAPRFIVYVSSTPTTVTLRIADTHAHAVAGTFLNIITAGVGGPFAGVRGVTLGPLFWETGESPSSDRGYITADDSAAGWATGHNVSYNSGSGWVEYTLSLPNRAMFTQTGGSASSPNDYALAGRHYLSVRGASAAALNGDFLIRATSAPTASTLLFSVENPNVTFTDDETLPDSVGSAAFQAGVFTDLLLTPSTGNRGIVGETLSSVWIPDHVLLTTAGVTTSGPIVSGVNEEIVLLGGDITATVTLDAVPLTSSGVGDTVSGWVRGDVLYHPSLPSSRRIRVTNVYAASDVAVSVTGDGTTAEFTHANVSLLSIGDVILLQENTDLAGTHTITDISGTTAFFESTFASTASATLLGNVLGLSEPLEFSGGPLTTETVSVLERWIPIEAVPRATTSAPNQTYTTYYSKNESSGPYPKFRSVMSAESMYLTNGHEIVFKYDGYYLSSAGLPRWSPLTGMSILSNRTTGIQNDDRDRAVQNAVAPVDGIYTLPTGYAADFARGDRVTYTDRAPSTVRQEYDYVVDSVDAATTDATKTSNNVRVSPSQTPSFDAAGVDFLKRSFARRYFVAGFRRDTNDRTTATSPFHINDAVIRFGYFHRPDLLVQQMPLHSLMDWRGVETHIALSTGRDGDPSFTFGAVIPSTYSPATFPSGLFQDGVQAQDAALRNIPNTSLDIFNNIFGTPAGPALRATVDRPPIGKCITNATNRLLLGNISSRPRASITAFVPPGFVANPSDLGSTTGAGHTISITASASPAMNFEFVLANAGGAGVSPSVLGLSMNVTDMNGSIVTLRKTAGTFTSAGVTGVVPGTWCQLQDAFDTRTSTVTDVALLAWYNILTVTTDNTITVATPHRARATITSVTPATDVITISTGHGLNAGDPVQFTIGTGGTGVIPAGLAANTQYYALPITPTTFKVYTTFEAAISNPPGTAVDITGVGTSPYYLLYLEQPNVLTIAFASSRANNYVPVIVSDTSTGSTGVATYNQTSGKNRTVPDKIPTREAMLLLTLKELGRAINAVASSQSFSPSVSQSGAPRFYCAALGNDSTTANTIEIESFDNTPFGVTITTTSSPTPTWYVNNARITSGVEVSSEILRFPNRVARSFRNFPEMFDQPFAQTLSESAIDVGEADGDEITAIVPRYGESFTNTALGQGAVLAFKSRSVYLIDVNTRQVAQIETNGQGAPYGRSVIRTKNGTEFANEAGLWKINESNQCIFIGQILTRYWERTVNRDATLSADVICGHHDLRRNRAITSVPINGETQNSEVASYDHTRENSDDRGSWTIYENFPVTGWSNAGSDSLFATTLGRVYSIRRAYAASDYQDDSDPVGGVDPLTGTPTGAYVLLGEKGFGAPGLRKRINSVSIGFRTDGGTSTTHDTSVVVEASINHSHDFEQLSTFALQDPDAGDEDNLSGESRGNVKTLLFSLPVRKAEYVQIRVSDATRSRCVEVTDLAYLVELLNSRGVPQAATD